MHAPAARMGGMTEHQVKRGGYLGLLVAAIPVSVPLLYILSSGPTLTFVASGRWTTDIYRAVYWPLIYVARLSPTIANVWQWYLQLWTG